MGYTHYWRRAPQLDPVKFARAAADIKPVLRQIELMGVQLAGPLGSGPVELSDDGVGFNGRTKCGHEKRSLGITWPAENAGGVGSKTQGHWFAGSLLEERTCGGDCSHESFYVPRDIEKTDWQTPDESGRFFEFCKTAYKPYDLAVTAALIILSKYLGDQIVISSDGEDKDWKDGANIVQLVHGYGRDFTLPKEVVEK